MGGWFEDFGWLMGWIDWIVPMFIVIISILSAASMIKWGKRISLSVKVIMEHPWKIVFWIAIMFALLFIWFHFRDQLPL